MPNIYNYAGDATAARQQGMQEGERQVMKIGNMAAYMEQALASGNDRAVQGAWNAVRPELEKLSGQQMSPTWLPEYEPKMQEAKARAAALRDPNQQSAALQEFDALSKNLSPEDVQKARRVKLGLDPRAVTGAAKANWEVVGRDGRKRPGVFDPSTQQFSVLDESTNTFRPIGQGETLTQVAAPAGPDMQPDVSGGMVDATQAPNAVAIDGFTPEQNAAMSQLIQGMPSDQATAIIQSITGRGQTPASSAGLAVGLSPQEEAIQKAQGTAGVELATAPAIEAATKQAGYNVDIANKPTLEAAVTTAGKTAEADVTRATEAAKKVKSARTVVSLLDDAEKILTGPVKPTGSAIGTAADVGAAFFGQTLPGGPEAKQLETIASNLTLQVPRMEGPQSNFDQQLYRDNVANIGDSTQPVATRLAALKIVRALQEKYEALNSAAPAAPAATQRPALPAGFSWED